MISCLPGSSGSDASVDEKRMRRRISNRESARKSRMKKQKHLQGLTTEMGKLERERDEISEACSARSRSHLVLRSENDALLAEKTALIDYLNSINAVIGKFKESSWPLTDSSEAGKPHEYEEGRSHHKQLGGTSNVNSKV